VKAGDLRAGDFLEAPLGGWRRVVSVKTLAGEQTVYNFTVDQDHDYFVGQTGFLVHNAGCGCGPGTFPEEIFSSKAPWLTEPGVPVLEGQYFNDRGPWGLDGNLGRLSTINGGNRSLVTTTTLATYRRESQTLTITRTDGAQERLPRKVGSIFQVNGLGSVPRLMPR